MVRHGMRRRGTNAPETDIDANKRALRDSQQRRLKNIKAQPVQDQSAELQPQRISKAARSTKDPQTHVANAPIRNVPHNAEEEEEVRLRILEEGTLRLTRDIRGMTVQEA